jgi:hypothetical protein
MLKISSDVCEVCVIDVLRKLRRLSWQDRLLLLESVVYLAIAGFAIRALPFRFIGRLAERPNGGMELPRHIRLTTVRRVRWAISQATARVPWQTMCFQQGLAAQLMLRRRGLPSVLYYGAAQHEPIGLHTHVWVRVGDIDVIGTESVDRFAVLATFPSQPGNAIKSK